MRLPAAFDTERAARPCVWEQVRPKRGRKVTIQTCRHRLPVLWVIVQALITVRLNLSVSSHAIGASQLDERWHCPLLTHNSVRCQAEGKGPNVNDSSHHTRPDQRVSHSQCQIDKSREYKHRKDELVKSFARGSRPAWHHLFWGPSIELPCALSSGGRLWRTSMRRGLITS